MAISRFKTSSVAQGLPKYQKISNLDVAFPTTNLIAKYATPPSSGSTWTDTVGGYNLTLSGTTYNSSVGGNLTMGSASNNSFSMNGTSDYTFAIWANPTSLSGTSYTTMYPLFGVSNTSTPGSLLVGAGTNSLYMNGYDNNGFNAVGTVSTNIWQLFTFCLGAGNSASVSDIYINSVKQSWSGVYGYGGAKPTPLNIGSAATLNTNTWHGYIGSVYIWNKKLSSNDVSALFENTRTRFGV